MAERKMAERKDDKVRAIFGEPEAAYAAVRGLIAAGVDRGRIVVTSNEPFLVNGEPAAASTRSLIGIFTLFGAGIGALAGWALVYYTSHVYPIATGGMPLVPALTTGLIMYETAAVGALLFALGRFLMETRLPGWSRVQDDEMEAIASGGLLLSADAGDSESVRVILMEAGGQLLDEEAPEEPEGELEADPEAAAKAGEDGESGRVGKDGSPLSL